MSETLPQEAKDDLQSWLDTHGLDYYDEMEPGESPFSYLVEDSMADIGIEESYEDEVKVIINTWIEANVK